MTVTSDVSRVSYAGDAITTDFTVPFYFIADGDLKVLVLDAIGAETTLVLTTDYTVAGAGDQEGGTVTFLYPPAFDETVFIYRDPALTQLADYTANSRFPAESHERALDRGVMIDQRTREMIGRTLRVPESDDELNPLPTAEMRANSLLGFDADGVPTLAALGSGSGGGGLFATDEQARQGSPANLIMDPVRVAVAISYQVPIALPTIPVTIGSETFPLVNWLEGLRGPQGLPGPTGPTGSGVLGAAAARTTWDPRYPAIGITPDGSQVTAFDTQNVATPGPHGDSGVFARSTGRGTAIELDSVLAAVNTGTIIYSGPVYDGVAWLRSPKLDVSGNIIAEVNWSRSANEKDWWPVTISPTTGMQIPASWATSLWFLSNGTGNSHSRGGTDETPRVITTTAVDATYALMPDITNVVSDIAAVGVGATYAAAPRTMGNFATLGTAGENHVPFMTLTILAAMQAAGAKVPIFGVTWGQGGHKGHHLSPNFLPATADDYPALTGFLTRVGGIYQHMIRGVLYELLWAKDAGVLPAFLPFELVHGANESLASVTAANYEWFPLQMHAAINADLRRLGDWHPQAPDLPLVLVQDSYQAANMVNGATRIFGKGVDGPGLCQWSLAQRYPEKFIMAGPMYWMPTSSPTLPALAGHLAPSGSARMGEMIGWAKSDSLVKRHKPFTPKAVYRQSSTVIHIIPEIPEGTLAFDTTNVADALDGMKGFVVWSAATLTQVTLASVALGPGNKYVTLTLAAPNTTELWVDYACWRDPAYTGPLGPTYGPRGNLRCSTAHASLLPNWTNPDTGLAFPATNNYRWMPAFRVPVPTTVDDTLYCDGRIA